MGAEPIEQSNAVRILDVVFKCEKPFDVTREMLLQAASTSHFQDEIRAKYFRKEGFSVVQAIVAVCVSPYPK